MSRSTVVALARAVQDEHRRLARLPDLPEDARKLIAEIGERIATLVDELHERERKIDSLHELLGDRMNNLLMAILTVRDLLRALDAPATDSIRSRLESTVSNGRDSVKRFRESVAKLR